MTANVPSDRLARAVARICVEPRGERQLRVSVLDELRKSVTFDWFAWLLTDPVTEVGTAPLASAPSVADLPRLIRAKYLTDVNRWTSMNIPVATLHTSVGGALDRSLFWREMLSGYSVTDVASIVFRDPRSCWGWLDLWRVDSEPFDERDLDILGSVVGPITKALKHAQARTFEDVPPKVAGGPAVLVLSPELDVAAQTPDSEAYLRILVPPDDDQRPIPAGAYNVAAQLLSVEAGVDSHAASARVHLRDGLWLTFRAARAVGEGVIDSHIAVAIEPSTPAERRDIFARSHDLTARESEVLEHLALGSDTRAIAESLFVSEHTVQDHLKSIFAKTGTRSRPTLVARSSGG